MPPSMIRVTTERPVIVCKAKHGAYKTTPMYNMMLTAYEKLAKSLTIFELYLSSKYCKNRQMKFTGNLHIERTVKKKKISQRLAICIQYGKSCC